MLHGDVGKYQNVIENDRSAHSAGPYLVFVIGEGSEEQCCVDHSEMLRRAVQLIAITRLGCISGSARLTNSDMCKQVMKQ